jgi:hypothetical protein
MSAHLSSAMPLDFVLSEPQSVPLSAHQSLGLPLELVL